LRTRRTEFILGQFAVSVLVEFLESLGGFREFVGINGAILVGIECVHDRAHRTESLSAGAARKPLSRPTFSARLSFAAWAEITLRAVATGLVATGLVTARTFSTRLIALRTFAARTVSLWAFACGTVSAGWARRWRVLGNGDV
jgi:hypothetical protein